MYNVSGLLSGRWRGSYEDNGKSHGWIVNLVVNVDGTISGSGHDDDCPRIDLQSTASVPMAKTFAFPNSPVIDLCNGGTNRFIINGTWSSSRQTVVFSKRYALSPAILFRGIIYPDKILGRWTIESLGQSGTFVLEYDDGRKFTFLFTITKFTNITPKYNFIT